GFGVAKCLFCPPTHQIKFSFTGLGNTGGHARLERLCPREVRQLLNFDVHLRRNRRAIYEELASRVHQQIVITSSEYVSHRRVIGHDGENNVRFRSYLRQVLRRGAAELTRKGCSDRAIAVINSGDMELSILQSARHVCAHTTYSNKTDVHKKVIFRLIRKCRLSPFAGEKWIVLLFFAHSSHWTVSRADDRLIRQRKNLLQIISQRVGVGNVSTAH